MENQFSIDAFKGSFDKDLKKLANAEKVTKDLLRDMSRGVLNALHVTEDISYVNRLIQKLTPVNRKVAILFYKEFAGFNWNEDEAEFGKKDKKKYDAKKTAALAALEDPHFNLWTWADRNIDIEKKPLKLTDVTKFIEKTLKRAGEDGVAQADVIKAILEGGLEIDALMAVVQAMGEQE